MMKKSAHKESTSLANRLVGRWQLVRAEGSVELGNVVTATFTPDGKLTYVIHNGDRQQIMNLTYTIVGDKLITDQPSMPKEETTKFWFDPGGQLVLEYGGIKTWFVLMNNEKAG
jgi:hypothetical protein